MLRDVYFDVNQATLLPESEARLNEAGAAIEKFADLKVEVQGHTDSRGAAKYNEKLSQARAETVREYLLAHFQLKADNLIAKGYGESQLAISPEKSADDYAMNRRVVLRAINAEVLPGCHDRTADQVAHLERRSPRRRKAPGASSVQGAAPRPGRAPPVAVYDRIIVSAILKRSFALSACGTFAGMRIMSPARRS